MVKQASFFCVKTYLGLKKDKSLLACCFLFHQREWIIQWQSDCAAALFTFASSHVSQPFSCLQAGFAVKDWNKLLWWQGGGGCGEKGIIFKWRCCLSKSSSATHPPDKWVAGLNFLENSLSLCGLVIDAAGALRCGISSISRKTPEVSGQGTVSGLLSRHRVL